MDIKCMTIQWMIAMRWTSEKPIYKSAITEDIVRFSIEYNKRYYRKQGNIN